MDWWSAPAGIRVTGERSAQALSGMATQVLFGLVPIRVNIGQEIEAGTP
jgi:hypothetical protein